MAAAAAPAAIGLGSLESSSARLPPPLSLLSLRLWVFAQSPLFPRSPFLTGSCGALAKLSFSQSITATRLRSFSLFMEGRQSHLIRVCMSVSKRSRSQVFWSSLIYTYIYAGSVCRYVHTCNSNLRQCRRPRIGPEGELDTTKTMERYFDPSEVTRAKLGTLGSVCRDLCTPRLVL